jgi:hypothetical protein
MLPRWLQFLGRGPQPRLGKLYAFDAAPGLRVHLAPMECAKQGPLRDACVAYVFGPERDPEYLYMHAAMYDLCLPPLIVPKALFTGGSCTLMASPMSLRAQLFKQHVFYDPACKKRYDINGVMFQYLGEFCSLLKVTGAAELQARIVNAREAMLSNHAPGLDGVKRPAVEPMPLPPESHLNEKQMCLVAQFPSTLEVMDDPEMDISTIEDALISALERQRIGSLDGNGFGEGQIDLFVDAAPGAYASVLRTIRGVLMAIGVKEFTITLGDLAGDGNAG